MPKQEYHKQLLLLYSDTTGEKIGISITKKFNHLKNLLLALVASQKQF
jgi:hypothetical protein